MTERLMRAKLTVSNVDRFLGYDNIKFRAVAAKSYQGTGGADENNTFARFTPNAALEMTINNPDLVGKISPGDTFYVDFIPTEY